MKQNKIESDFKFEDLFIGLNIINIRTNQISTITNLTSNSIEVFNTANKKLIDKENKLKGISSTNWYDLSWFNRRFKKVNEAYI